MEESIAKFLSVVLPEIRHECNRDPSESSSAMTRRILADCDSQKTNSAKIITSAMSELIRDIKSDLKMEISMMIQMELDDFRASLSPVNNNNATVPKGFSTSMSKKTEKKSCQDPLLSNPLFQMVSKSIDRAERGNSSYTAEEYANARGDRFDEKSRELFLATAEKFKPVNFDKHMLEASESSEDDRWEKLMKTREG